MSNGKKNFPKGSIGWHIELARKVGYPEIEELKKTLVIVQFKKWTEEKGIFKSHTGVNREQRERYAKDRGLGNNLEYWRY